MGTPRHNPRAILRDSLSTLAPKEGAGRAPSLSDEATNSKRAYVLASETEFKRAEKWCSYSNSSQPCWGCLKSSVGIWYSLEHWSRPSRWKKDSTEMPEADKMEDIRSKKTRLTWVHSTTDPQTSFSSRKNRLSPSRETDFNAGNCLEGSANQIIKLS